MNIDPTEVRNTEISNKIIMINGLPGEGKSFFAAFLASFYPEIWSNLEIKKNGVIVSNTIKGMGDLKKLKFSPKKGVILFEESGINVSSRKFMSDDNMEFSKIGFLGRKFNKDLIFISQLKRTVDINIRELCRFTFEMHKFHDENGKMLFEATIYNRFDQIIGVKEIDLLEWAKITGYEYNTLEDSVIVDSQIDREKRNSEREYRGKKDFGLNLLTV